MKFSSSAIVWSGYWDGSKGQMTQLIGFSVTYYLYMRFAWSVFCYFYMSFVTLCGVIKRGRLSSVHLGTTRLHCCQFVQYASGSRAVNTWWLGVIYWAADSVFQIVFNPYAMLPRFSQNCLQIMIHVLGYVVTELKNINYSWRKIICLKHNLQSTFNRVRGVKNSCYLISCCF